MSMDSAVVEGNGCGAKIDGAVGASAVRPLPTLHMNPISLSLSTCHCLKERFTPS